MPDVRYEDTREHSFWGHLDVSRLSVPRYQNIFRILVWLFFLGVFSQAGTGMHPSLPSRHSYRFRSEGAIGQIGCQPHFF